MKKTTEQIIKYALKGDETISAELAESILRLLVEIGNIEKRRGERDGHAEEVGKCLVQFTNYIRAQYDNGEKFDVKSAVRYCRKTYGRAIGDKVYGIFRSNLLVFNFKIGKHDNQNVFLDYIHQP